MRIVFLLLVLMVAPSLEAHHSTSAEFDLQRPVTVTGAVTRLEWMNPHAWLYVDTMATAGRPVEHWAFELMSPSEMIRRGWKRSSLRLGEIVVADAVLAKNGGNTGSIRSLTLADGTRMLTVFVK